MLWMFHPYLPLGKTEEKIFQYAKTILEHLIVNSEEVKNILTKCRLRLLDVLLEAPKHIKHEAYMFNLDQSSKWVVSLLVFNRKWCKEDVIFLRSEEHTSELQSRFDLVCRLLLEKKKICIL